MCLCVRQVPSAVQAGQSMREIHPGIPQERQRPVLQAQEQPPAGGVGALNGVVQLPHRVSSAIARKTPSRHPLNNVSC